MQPLLSSSTGEIEQSGITCGGTLTVGFEGGRIPAAAAGGCRSRYDDDGRADHARQGHRYPPHGAGARARATSELLHASVRPPLCVEIWSARAP